eukprot:GHVR01189319.1.p1 GENE.GHVR01189319.1~~GHVR01189319.1.p1  ORF type:complete len:362 (+),score=75.98 GHVR01189319.1:132-1217(+)
MSTPIGHLLNELVPPNDRRLLANFFDKVYSLIDNQYGDAEAKVARGIPQNKDVGIIAEYFLEKWPNVLQLIINEVRLDLLPFDRISTTLMTFSSDYKFFKLDISNRADKALTSSGRQIVGPSQRLTLSTDDALQLNIPELSFGTEREIIISFHFSIDRLRHSAAFGFNFGSSRVYFEPEVGSDGGCQFRHMYVKYADAEPTPLKFNTFAFLEGEVMSITVVIRLDNTSEIHLCKATKPNELLTTPIFTTNIKLNGGDASVCSPSCASSSFISIFIDGGVMEAASPDNNKTATISNFVLLQILPDANSPPLYEAVDIKTRASALKLLDAVSGRAILDVIHTHTHNLINILSFFCIFNNKILC